MCIARSRRTCTWPTSAAGLRSSPVSRSATLRCRCGAGRHGEGAEFTEHGGVVIHGRSDATLHPGGVRIGTAEIYRQVDALPEILESLAIGQRIADDERIVLFVRLRPGFTLDEALRE